MQRMFAVALPALLGLACQSPAAEPIYAHAGTPTGLFLSLDRDQDGYLDKAELQSAPAWAAEAGHVDRNRDMRIDHSEFLSLLDRLDARR